MSVHVQPAFVSSVLTGGPLLVRGQHTYNCAFVKVHLHWALFTPVINNSDIESDTKKTGTFDKPNKN